MGFTKMANVAKLANLDSSKVWHSWFATTKQSDHVGGQYNENRVWFPWSQVQTSNIDSWRFHEIGKLRKWGIGQEIHRRFAKTQMRWQRAILTNGDHKKMANLGEKGKSAQKWRVQGFGQIQMRWQKGHLEKWQVYKNCKFGKNFKRMTKEACP